MHHFLTRIDRDDFDDIGNASRVFLCKMSGNIKNAIEKGIP
jgi:hypothetical protein